MPQLLVEAIENVCDRFGGVVVPNEGEHKGTVSEINSQEYLAAFTAFHGVHLNYRNIRIGFNVLQEVIIGSSYVTLLVDPNGLFLLPDAKAHLPRKVDISGSEKSGIDVVVDGLLVQHDLGTMLDADVVYGMPLLHQRGNDSVNTLQFLIRDSKALAAFTAYVLVFLLGVLGIVEMPLVLAAMPFRTSITDIRGFQNSEAMTFHVFSAGFITSLAAGAAVLAELFAAGFADIPVVLTGSTVNARIVRICFHDLDVSFDFF